MAVPRVSIVYQISLSLPRRSTQALALARCETASADVVSKYSCWKPVPRLRAVARYDTAHAGAFASLSRWHMEVWSGLVLVVSNAQIFLSRTRINFKGLGAWSDGTLLSSYARRLSSDSLTFPPAINYIRFWYLNSREQTSNSLFRTGTFLYAFHPYSCHFLQYIKKKDCCKLN